MAIQSIIYQVIAFLVAITIHESAHAWMAYRLGDPTAKLSGRLSLNPIAHIDIYGTVLIPLFLIFIGSPFVFGWAKPVVFDPFNLQDPRRDSAMISLAGPTSNFIAAIVLAIVLRLITPVFWLSNLLTAVIAINIVLGIFNLVPVHPLDGGKIFVGFLPEDQAEEADMFLHRYGLLILLFLIFPIFGGQSPLFTVLGPVINFILNILVP
jgi:Zn-dependent protease